MKRRLQLATVFAALVAGMSWIAIEARSGELVRPTQRNAGITGVVVDSSTGSPVSAAVVSISTIGDRRNDVTERQLTDERGRFAFVDLAADVDYLVRASKLGFLEGAHGRKQPGSQAVSPIVLLPGQLLDGVKIEVWPLGAITGAVSDEAGEPMVGVFVQLLRKLTVAGRTRFATGPVTVTDDRGAYTFESVAPGQYVVRVPGTPASSLPLELSGVPPGLRGLIRPDGYLVAGHYPIPPGSSRTYPAGFNGSVWSLADAEPLTVSVGEQRGGVHIRMTPSATFQVRGAIHGAVSRTSAAIQLIHAADRELGLDLETGVASLQADGTFAFYGVPAGSYVVTLPASLSRLAMIRPTADVFYAPALPRFQEYGRMGSTGQQVGVADGVQLVVATLSNGAATADRSIEVSRDLDGIELVPTDTASLSGRIVVERTDIVRRSRTTRLLLALESATADPTVGMPGAAADGDGAFNIRGIRPGLYIVTSPSRDWHVKSVRIDGKDRSYVPIRIEPGQVVDDVVVTLTNSAGSLVGTVTDPAGTAVRATVLVFPAEPEQWVDYGFNPRRIASVETDNRGQYEVPALPGGEYYVAAVSGSQDSWRTPGFFAAVTADAKRTSLGWGQRVACDVTLSRRR
jgi:hypothetical protein